MSLVESLPHTATPLPVKTPDARIGVRGAGKSYGGLEVFRNINLEVGDAEIVAIVGPSGCGTALMG